MVERQVTRAFDRGWTDPLQPYSLARHLTTIKMRSESPTSDAEMRSLSPSSGADKRDAERENGTGKPGSHVVIVSNLSKNIVEVHLRGIFSNYGDIRKLDLPLHSKCKHYPLSVAFWPSNTRI